MKLKDIAKLAVSIILCQLAGFLGSLFTTPAIPTWYQTLHKPFFTPPNWIFSPVWISLFVLMGVSLFLVWRRQDHPKAKTALIFFFIQLILNILWSAAFFGLKFRRQGTGFPIDHEQHHICLVDRNFRLFPNGRLYDVLGGRDITTRVDK